ncbi:transposase [Myxococcota bacterium]|nr:transposase [Myxococcota bacterium]
MHYERTPGDALRPLPATYRRREPEKTALHSLVHEHLETLLAQARQASVDNSGYPAFVEKEFRRYLDCGILANGFARLRCPTCGFERLVAFSCKGRLCPSCWAKRAAETAAHLVDHVLPEATYRQWDGGTFPWEARLFIAIDRQLLSDLLRDFLRTIFSWQRRRGRLAGLTDGHCGAVTFVQRFGGALNTNPHFHVLIPPVEDDRDGLFTPGASEDDRAQFVPLPPPMNEDIAHLGATVSTRLTKRLRETIRKARESEADRDDTLVATLLHRAVQLALWLPRSGPAGDDSTASDHGSDTPKPLCAKVDGFSLHAFRTVAPHDRAGLEQLCRYGLRAPFALDRISIAPNGNVLYQLHRPWPKPNSPRTHLTFEPVAFLRRLAALVPYPYQNLVRYHGVFANRSRLRPLLPSPPGAPLAGTASEKPQAESTPAPPPALAQPPKRHRYSWAHQLKRSLHADALVCPKCAALLRVLAFIANPIVVVKILDHLSLPSSAPIVAPARMPEDEFPLLDTEFAGDDFEDPDRRPTQPKNPQRPGWS